ncbi:MAG: alpha/beta fold hydrolase [Cyclobacteriaceae bacterium]|nr:alpha/beta fold hydrolase [Cyclobacteriaceae bacterium]
MLLNYKVMGEGHPLIVLHGFLGTLDNWVSFGRELSKTHKVYLIDQRNHGRSPHSEVFNYDVMVNDLLLLLEEHEIQQPVLLGHSMGGKVAMSFVKKYPEQVSKLIVVDIAPKEYPQHHQRLFDGMTAIDLGSIASRQEANTKMAAHVNSEGIRQFLLKNLERNHQGFRWRPNIDVLKNKQHEVLKGLDGENLSALPAYFIKGGESNYILPEDRKDIKLKFPNAKILTIKGASHWVHADKAEPFLKTIKHILRD